MNNQHDLSYSHCDNPCSTIACSDKVHEQIEK